MAHPKVLVDHSSTFLGLVIAITKQFRRFCLADDYNDPDYGGEEYGDQDNYGGGDYDAGDYYDNGGGDDYDYDDGGMDFGGGLDF